MKANLQWMEHGSDVPTDGIWERFFDLRGVGVVHADDQLAVVLFRVLGVENDGLHVADVEVAGRLGGEAGHHLAHFGVLELGHRPLLARVFGLGLVARRLFLLLRQLVELLLAQLFAVGAEDVRGLLLLRELGGGGIAPLRAVRRRTAAGIGERGGFENG